MSHYVFTLSVYKVNEIISVVPDIEPQIDLNASAIIQLVYFVAHLNQEELAGMNNPDLFNPFTQPFWNTVIVDG